MTKDEFNLSKLYMHNLNQNQEYKINNTWLKIYNAPENKMLSVRIEDIEIHIPLNKFNKIIENMDGKCTYEGVTFNLKKKNKNDSNITLEIIDEIGNVAKDEFQSIHYNAAEHLQLIQHLRNEKDYIVIGIDDDRTKLSILISNESIINKNREHYEVFKCDIDLKDYKLFKSHIPQFLKYINENVDAKIIVHNKEATEMSLGVMRLLKEEDTIDFESIVSRADYKKYFIEKHSMGKMFDRAHQRTNDLLNFYTNEEGLNKIKEIIENNKILEKDMEQSNIKFDDKLDKYRFISEKHFKLDNENNLIKFMEKNLDFNFRSTEDKVKIESAFLFANKNNLINVVDYMIEEFKKSGRPFYLNNYGATILTINLQKNHLELIEKTYDLYKKGQFNSDGVVFQSNLIARDNLIEALSNSNIDLELKEKILDNLNLSEFKEIVIKDNSLDLSK